VFRTVRKRLSFDDDNFEKFSCVVLEGNKVVIDSSGYGRLKITDSAIQKAQLPDTVFVDLDHSDGVLSRIGFADNFRKQGGNRVLADIHVVRTTQAGRDAIALLQHKLITDVSVKMSTKEIYSREDRMLALDDFTITGLSVVTVGADSSAKVFSVE